MSCNIWRVKRDGMMSCNIWGVNWGFHRGGGSASWTALREIQEWWPFSCIQVVHHWSGHWTTIQKWNLVLLLLSTGQKPVKSNIKRDKICWPQGHKNFTLKFESLRVFGFRSSDLPAVSAILELFEWTRERVRKGVSVPTNSEQIEHEEWNRSRNCVKLTSWSKFCSFN